MILLQVTAWAKAGEQSIEHLSGFCFVLAQFPEESSSVPYWLPINPLFKILLYENFDTATMKENSGLKEPMPRQIHIDTLEHLCYNRSVFRTNILFHTQEV